MNLMFIPRRKNINLYRNILNEEIDIINPKLIVTLGDSAEKSCRSLLEDDYYEKSLKK